MLVIRKPSSQKVFCSLVLISMLLAGASLFAGENRRIYFLYISFFGAALSLISFSELAVSQKSIFTNFVYCVGIVLLGAMMAFRAQTGLDDPAYRRSYLRAADLSYIQYFNLSSFEVGFKSLAYFLYGVFGDNYNIVQVIVTYASFCLWGIAIKQYGPRSSIAAMTLILITHYYLLIMGPALVRMFIAIPIVFLSLRYLWERKTSMYILGIVCAAMFHLSSLFMLILIPFSLRGKSFYRNWHVVMLSIFIAIPVSFLFIAKVLVPLLPSTKYSAYATVRGLSLSLGKFDMVPVWLIGYINFRHVEKKDRDMYTIAMVLISLSIMISFYSSMVSVGRLIYYANLGVILLFGMMWKQKRGNRFHDIFMVALTAYSVVYFFHSGFMNAGIKECLFNYKAFF